MNESTRRRHLAGEIVGLQFAGRPGHADDLITQTPTAELYTLRRDLARLVERITDETERRHQTDDATSEAERIRQAERDRPAF